MTVSHSDEEENSTSNQGIEQRARQERIRSRVIAEGFVRNDQLAEEFSVTPMTIHRDLDVLQRQGWLRKVRGGATAQPSPLFHGDIRHRLQTLREVKEELAHTAITFVHPGQSVMLDESTTGLCLAQLLPAQSPLTVVTHFLAVIKMLTGEPGIDLIALGGTYYPAYDAFFGLLTTATIHLLHADVLFMSTTAITDGFCYHQSQETITVKRALMNASNYKILMVDHSKFSKRSLFQLAPLTDFDLIIVDKAIETRDLKMMQDLGVKVHIAGTESTESKELLASLRSYPEI